jgi:hypothetical protein
MEPLATDGFGIPAANDTTIAPPTTDAFAFAFDLWRASLITQAVLAGWAWTTGLALLRTAWSTPTE